jgi:hypothetical protein
MLLKSFYWTYLGAADLHVALQTLPLLNRRASHTPPSVVPDILGVCHPSNYTLSHPWPLELEKNSRENCVLYYLKGEFRSVNQNKLKQWFTNKYLSTPSSLADTCICISIYNYWACQDNQATERGPGSSHEVNCNQANLTGWGGFGSWPIFECDVIQLRGVAKVGAPLVSP